MWEGSDKIFPDRVGNFSYTHLENLAQVYRVNYLYIIYVIYICVWDRGQGDTVASQSMLAISYTKAHGTQTQCSEENAGKYDRNDDTHLYCTSLQAAVQLRATNAASMKAQWARAAHALHTQRFCAAHAPLTLAVWNGRERDIASLVSDLRLCVLNASPFENRWWRFTANHRTVFTDDVHDYRMEYIVQPYFGVIKSVRWSLRPQTEHEDEEVWSVCSHL